MKKRIKILFFIFLAFFLNEGKSQGIARHNISHKYYPYSDIRCRVKSCKTEKQSIFYFEVLLPGRPDNFFVSYHLLKEITNRRALFTDTVSFSKNLISSVSNYHYLKAEAPVTGAKWILVEIISPQEERSYYFDFPIADNAGLLLFKNENLPIFNNYISTTDTVIVKDFKGKERIINAQMIKYPFSPADPPAYLDEGEINKTITIDSTFVIRHNVKNLLGSKGLYFFYPDTNSEKGVSIRVEDIRYPELSSIHSLIDGAIYLTTNEEFQKMKKAPEAEKKKEFDKFWIEQSKTADRGKKIIRNYYQHIEDANKIFTGYKEGWKTPQGMIYVIFGMPDMVIRKKGIEMWYYDEKEEIPSLKFKFVHLPVKYSANNYVLVPKKKYENVWFHTIGLWRKGRIN